MKITGLDNNILREQWFAKVLEKQIEPLKEIKDNNIDLIKRFYGSKAKFVGLKSNEI